MQVSLLVVMEIGLFPLICGWWLDICSLVSSDTTVLTVNQLLRLNSETLFTSFKIDPANCIYVLVTDSEICMFVGCRRCLMPL